MAELIERKILNTVKSKLRAYPTGIDIEFPRMFQGVIVRFLWNNSNNEFVFTVVDPDDTWETFTIGVCKTQEELDKRESMR